MVILSMISPQDCGTRGMLPRAKVGAGGTALAGS
jgi:hypothetical protein